MKKILIIGSKGFIGSAALRYYKSAGYHTFGCDVISGGRDRDYFKVTKENPEYNEVLKSISPDLCFNASGAASPHLSFENPLKDYELNVVNVIKILEPIKISTPRTIFINISSAFRDFEHLGLCRMVIVIIFF